MAPEAVKRQEFFQAVARLVVDRVAFGNPLELNRVHKESLTQCIFRDFRKEQLLFPFAKSLCHVKRIPELPRCLATAQEPGSAGVDSIETGTPGDSFEDVQDVIDA